MGVFFIGICGGSGSGKTTLAKCLQQKLGEKKTVIISQDNYYKDQQKVDSAARSHINFDDPNCLEFQLLVEHLHELRQRRPVRIPIYDFSTHTRRGGVMVGGDADYVILEGHLIFNHEHLRKDLDVKIYLEHDTDIMLIRRIRRDTKERSRTLEDVLEQYVEHVRPMYMKYVFPSRRWADVTIRTDGPVVDHVLEFLRSRKKTKL